jgi:WD40 repeat protein
MAGRACREPGGGATVAGAQGAFARARAPAGGFDGALRVWDVAAGACARVVRLRGGRFHAVAYHPAAGEYIAAAASDLLVRVYRAAAAPAAGGAGGRECVRELAGHSNAVTCVAFQVGT